MTTVSTTGLYPFDPHGTNPDCLVLNERQALQTPGRDDYYFIIPQAAPFFAGSLVVRDNDSGTTYVEGKDYVVGHWFVEAMTKVGRPIAGSIRFLRRDITGVVSLTYQTLGGEWGFDDQAILAELTNKSLNPLTRAWAQIDTLPSTFPPVDHDQSVDELIGFEEVVEEVSKVADAILTASDSGASQHALDTNNPHSVNKTQVGLGLVGNYPMASTAEAEAGQRSDRYMSPAATRAAVAAITDELSGGHITDTDNPHGVTKTQVGLGLVENYGMATLVEAEEGTRNDVYMSAATVYHAISEIALKALDTHANNRNNPHGVTQTQVGLSNVENFTLATQGEATAGERHDRYMTPLRVFEAIDFNALIPLGQHTADTNNPHEVTPEQIGTLTATEINSLIAGRLPVGGRAYDSERVFGMDQPALYEDVRAYATNSADDHIADETNPHKVTAVQVGTYTSDEINTLVDGRLAVDGTAADSAKLFGLERGELYNDIYASSGYAWNFTFAVQDAGTTQYVKTITRAAGGFGSSWLITHKTSTGEVSWYQLDIPSETEATVRKLNEVASELSFMTTVDSGELVIWVRRDAGEAVYSVTKMSGDDLDVAIAADTINLVAEETPIGTSQTTLSIVGSNDAVIDALVAEFDAATAELTA